jgi:tetratricopeptide (TPR) repeat protein
MSSIRRSIVIALAAWILLPPTPSRSADEESWVGKRIILKWAGVKIGHTGDDGKPVYVAELTDMAYSVLKQDNGWLRVRHGGAEGWFPKEHAILTKDAVSYFNERLQMNPREALAYALRGRAWREQGDLDRALRDFDDAIRFYPLQAGWFRNRGALYEEKRDYDRAIQDFNDAARLNPQDALTYLARGLAYKGKKDYEKAMADYAQAIRLDPKWANPYYNRANLYKAGKEYDKALADYSEAIKLDPKDPDALFNRANIYKAKKEYDKAVADYQAVIRLDPKDPDAYDSLAWVLATCPDAKVRDGAKAVDCAGTACELTDAQSGYFMATLAAAFAEMGKYEQAVKWQKRALEFPRYDKEEGDKARQRLKLFEAGKPYREE